MPITPGPDLVTAAIWGGAVLGGGGGGRFDQALAMADGIHRGGQPAIVDIADLPADATLVTVAAVGAPAGKGAHATPADHVRAVVLLQERGVQIDGLIANECGALASINGWVQSAVLGLPVVDAPGNGRAHPTAEMGSLGVGDVPGYQSVQCAVGGRVDLGNRLELQIAGTLSAAAALVRRAAAVAGGLVAVARNPLPASYVRQRGALGAIRQSIAIGQAMLAAAPGLARIQAAADALGDADLLWGTVQEVRRRTAGGFDAGHVLIAGDAPLRLRFLNEFLTAEQGDRRLATFPDLVTLLAHDTGQPLGSAEVARGQQVAVLMVPARRLRLSSAMQDARLLRALEQKTGLALLLGVAARREYGSYGYHHQG